MPNTLISVDLRRSPEEQTLRPHNRWHPEIPPVATVDPGTYFRVECLDATGGQVVNSDSANDVTEIDLHQLSYLSGPIAVHGARPGDLLVVETLGVGPLPGAEWGYTALLDRSLGLGLLADEYPEARKAIWDLNGIFASSRHIEGVRFAGMPHPAVIGCAPTTELLRQWNEREATVLSTRSERSVRGVAIPRVEGALLGHAAGREAERLGREAARTWAVRENGGSIDTKELTPGSRLFLPVFAQGANLSVGDLQFSQGDGKITGFGGIKMAGWVDMHVDLIPGGMSRYGLSTPAFEVNGAEHRHGDVITFQGISVGEGGEQRYLDIWTAYRQACRSAIQHLQRFGYTGEQAYTLLAAVPTQGRISCMLEHPNVCCTLALPEQVFDFEIGIDGRELSTMERGQLAEPS